MKALISLLFVIAAFAQTPLPFYDGFDSENMNPNWSWVREDVGLWSLTENPGWLRLSTNGNFHQPQTNSTESIPLVTFADGDLFIETKLEYSIDNCSGAGLMFYKDDDNFVDVMMIEEAEPNLQGIVSHNDIDNAHAGRNAVFLNWRPVYLRILKSGNQYTAFASPDADQWTVIGEWVNDLVVDGVIRAGLYAMDCDQNLHRPAYFDYFRADTEENLPVGMISFEANPGDHEISLRWITGSESNVSHFEIARNGNMVAEVTATNQPTGHSYTWRDTDLENGRSYEYSLVSIDLDGTRSQLGSVTASPGGSSIAAEFELHQNYPNPFNPETSIRFSLAEASNVSLSVYNVAGQEVATLVHGNLGVGSHTVNFDGTSLTSGVYLYRLTAGTFTAQKKMVLLK